MSHVVVSDPADAPGGLGDRVHADAAASSLRRGLRQRPPQHQAKDVMALPTPGATSKPEDGVQEAKHPGAPAPCP